MMVTTMGIITPLEEATMDTVQGIEETMEDPEWKETSSIVPYFLATTLLAQGTVCLSELLYQLQKGYQTSQER